MNSSEQGEEFAQALPAQVREARAALAAAVESGDSAAVPGALDELERLLLLARKHGIDIPAATDGPDQKDRS